jgi:hypothetical protein
MRQAKRRSKLKDLLQPRPQFAVHVSKSLIAQALWDYGEDELFEKALHMTEDEHAKVQRIAAWYEDPSFNCPSSGNASPITTSTPSQRSRSSRVKSVH